MLSFIVAIILSALGVLAYQDGAYAVACFDFALVGFNLGMALVRNR